MDLFIYTATVKELQLCKTSSRLEELIRQYVPIIKKLPIGNWWINSRVTKEEQILWYKLLTLAIELHSKKSKKVLPDFIYQAKETAHQNLLSSILGFEIKNNSEKGFKFDSLISYEQLLDWFEFDTVLELPPSTNYVENLNKIVGDRPVHFRVTFNNSLTSFDAYSTNLPKYTQHLVYAIRYKQVNFPTQPQTIWDLFLTELIHNAYTKDQLIVESDVLKLEQQITALKSLKDFYVKP